MRLLAVWLLVGCLAPGMSHAEFREAENLDCSGGELHDLLRRITTHEEALLQFVLRELAGGEGDSLDAVRRLFRDSHAGDPR